MADVFDLLTAAPAFYERAGWRSLPPCNFGGGPKPPPPPPPPPAPVRADMAQGEQALMVASRRKGLRSTIAPSEKLGVETALGTGSGPIATPAYSPPKRGY